MTWKKLTFVLIPHSQSGIKQISVHRNLIVALALLLIGAIGVMLFYIVGFKGKEYYLEQTRELEARNLALEEHIVSFDSSLTVMAFKVAHLESINTTIITESDISDIDLRLFGDVSTGTTEMVVTSSPRTVITFIDWLDRTSAAFEENMTALLDSCLSNEDFVRRLPSIHPATGYISREFGLSFDIYSKTEKIYQGADIQNISGTPVVATADGIVETIETSTALGRYIIINHGNGYKTRYAHLQTVKEMEPKVRISKNDTVTRGQQIGAIGRTGISINPVSAHLMYSIYYRGVPVNPREYFFAPDFAAVPAESATPPRG